MNASNLLPWPRPLCTSPQGTLLCESQQHTFLSQGQMWSSVVSARKLRVSRFFNGSITCGALYVASVGFSSILEVGVHDA